MKVLVLSALLALAFATPNDYELELANTDVAEEKGKLYA